MSICVVQNHEGILGEIFRTIPGYL